MDKQPSSLRDAGIRQEASPKTGNTLQNNYPDNHPNSMVDLYHVMVDKETFLDDEQADDSENENEKEKVGKWKVNEVNKTAEDDGLKKELIDEDHKERESPDAIRQKKTLRERLFNKVDSGSLRAAVFNLTALALGVGCQSLPQQFSRMSFIACFINFNLCAAAAFCTLKLMHLASKKVKETEYSMLVKKVLGNKMCNLLNVMIIVYMLGSFITYQINIYKLTGSLVYNFGGYKNDYATLELFLTEKWSGYLLKAILMYGMAFLVIFPTCLLENIGKMRFVAIIAVISLIYVIVVVMIEAPWFVSHYKSIGEFDQVNWWDISSGFDHRLYFFRGTSIIFFAFCGHAGAFPVFNALSNSIDRRVHKVVRNTLVIQYVLYLILGISGFLTAPFHTPDLIIYRENNGVFSSDIFMIIGQISVIVVLLMVTPVKYNSYRISFVILLTGSDKLTKKMNYLLTIGTLLVTTSIAYAYDVISNYLSVLGGFCAVLIGFLIPGYLYIYTNDYPRYHWKNVTVFIFCWVITVIGYVSGFRTLVEVIIGK